MNRKAAILLYCCVGLVLCLSLAYASPGGRRVLSYFRAQCSAPAYPAGVGYVATLTLPDGITLATTEVEVRGWKAAAPKAFTPVRADGCVGTRDQYGSPRWTAVHVGGRIVR